MTGNAWARQAWPEMIRAGTQLKSVPLVPGIRLHLASDPISLWQRTELTSGQAGLDPTFWAFAWAGGLALARYLLDHPETIRGRHAIDIACLHVGQSRVLHMPGELFVEYQLAAKKLRPDLHVAMAAYGDYGMGYIGTSIAYTQGGYETGPVSRVAPAVEDVLMKAMRELLK